MSFLSRDNAQYDMLTKKTVLESLTYDRSFCNETQIIFLEPILYPAALQDEIVILYECHKWLI